MPQPIRCWDITGSRKIRGCCITFAAFLTGPWSNSQEWNARLTKLTCGCVVRDVDTSLWVQLHMKSQVCFHTATYLPVLPCVPPFSLWNWNIMSRTLAGELYSSWKMHSLSFFFYLFASDTLVIYPCHVSVCTNYIAGTAEETILMHLI